MKNNAGTRSRVVKSELRPKGKLAICDHAT
jgi:hypothetical protein